MGSATISFGLVSIPVKLFAATQSQAGISFNMLHKKCGSRLKQQYICPVDNGEVVGREDTVKGYEFAKGQFVQFSEEELDKIEAVATETVDIAEFVPVEKVDPVYFEKPYYLAPEKGGEKAYRLLSEAMRASGRVALARYAARGKQYLVMVRPCEKGLAMQNLRYADEVRPMSEVPVPDADVREQELKLAQQLIDQIARDDFNPAEYKDDVKERMEVLIQQKVEGKEVQAAPVDRPERQVADLMEALKASLANKDAGGGRKPPKRAEPAAPAASAAAPAAAGGKKGRKVG
jgi:DNA end-binding protein Ku